MLTICVKSHVELCAVRFDFMPTMALWQTGTSTHLSNSTLLTIFVGIAAFAILAQLIMIIVIAIGAMKACQQIQADIRELKVKADPLISSSQAMIKNLAPMITELAAAVGSTAQNIDAIAGVVRDKADELSPTVTRANETFRAANETIVDLNTKTRAQIVSLNSTISTALEVASHFPAAIQNGIASPWQTLASLLRTKYRSASK